MYLALERRFACSFSLFQVYTSGNWTTQLDECSHVCEAKQKRRQKVLGTWKVLQRSPVNFRMPLAQYS